MSSPASSTLPQGDRPSVAFDVGPLHGPRTGVGNAVAWSLEALEALDSVTLLPYATSLRARLPRATRRLPLPAALASRWWPHWSPPLDRLLGRPDVVHGTNYVVPPASCPRAVSVYDCWFLAEPDLAVPDVRRAGEVLRRAVAEGATVVTSSKASTAQVRELLDTDRVRTILLGPPPRAASPKNPAPAARGVVGDDPFVLAIGTIERRKNLPLLVKAFAKLSAEHPTVRLVIAGRPGDDSVTLDRTLWRLDRPTAARITLLGEIDAATKARLLTTAAVLAYPSLDEGFGFPILEAAQFGVPVVASTAGSIPEIARNAALLSEPTDIDALAANLHWVLTDADIRRKLIVRGTRNLARFSWDRTAADLTELYVELTGRAR